MKVVANNINKNETKEIMNALLACVKDKNISASDRKHYYSEYLKLSASYIIQSR